MRPSKFIAQQEHRLSRCLTAAELVAINQARAFCRGGKRDTIKAMRAALQAVCP